ncbi:hypothetical protein ADJ79_04955 [Ottowia sp. oral taxon 894]|nr:hypothetical protein ADJ79_04955 [Ottowia sp. oral taxon 894]
MRRWSGAVYIFQQETNKQADPMRRICNDKFCFLEKICFRPPLMQFQLMHGLAKSRIICKRNDY